MLCFRSCTPTCTWKRFMASSFHGKFRGDGCARAAAATVLGEVADERVHVPEIGRIEDEASLLAALGKPRARQVREVEGERRRRKLQRFADAAGGQSLRAGLDEQTVDRKARFLGQGGQRLDGA